MRERVASAVAMADSGRIDLDRDCRADRYCRGPISDFELLLHKQAHKRSQTIINGVNCANRCMSTFPRDPGNPEIAWFLRGFCPSFVCQGHFFSVSRHFSPSSFPREPRNRENAWFLRGCYPGGQMVYTESYCVIASD